MKNDLSKTIQATQAVMLEQVKSCFSESEQDHLRCLVRLTTEFNDYLQSDREAIANLEDTKWSIDSIFSGIDSFCRVNAAYRVLVGATSSRVEWENVSPNSLKEQFVSTFYRFENEANFEKKCRLLLDLFKYQIVFAGVCYD